MKLKRKFSCFFRIFSKFKFFYVAGVVLLRRYMGFKRQKKTFSLIFFDYTKWIILFELFLNYILKANPLFFIKLKMP